MSVEDQGQVKPANPIGESIEIPKAQLREIIALNKELREKNHEMATDINGFMQAVKKLSTTLDFVKSPLKSAANIAKMVNNPEKFADVLSPILEIQKKYDKDAQ